MYSDTVNKPGCICSRFSAAKYRANKFLGVGRFYNLTVRQSELNVSFLLVILQK